MNAFAICQSDLSLTIMLPAALASGGGIVTWSNVASFVILGLLHLGEGLPALVMACACNGTLCPAPYTGKGEINRDQMELSFSTSVPAPVDVGRRQCGWLLLGMVALGDQETRKMAMTGRDGISSSMFIQIGKGY